MFIINNWRQASTPPLRLGGERRSEKKRPDTTAYLGGGICLAKWIGTIIKFK